MKKRTGSDEMTDESAATTKPLQCERPSVAKLFDSPQQQLRTVERWIDRGFFRQPDVMPPMPTGGAVGLWTPLLVPVGRNLPSTWNAYLNIIHETFPDIGSEIFATNSLEALSLCPAWRWVTIDLGAWWNVDVSMELCRVRGRHSAGIEVLAAAAMFPRWIAAMAFDDRVPFVAMPALRCCEVGEPIWWHSPSMGEFPPMVGSPTLYAGINAGTTGVGISMIFEDDSRNEMLYNDTAYPVFRPTA